MDIQGFLLHLRTRGYSEGTVISYRSELQKFERFLKERKLRVNQVKPLGIERYLRWRDAGSEHRPATIRRRLAALSSFYDFVGVMSNGHVRNPVRPLRRPRRQPPNPQPLNERQIAMLMDGVSNPRDTAILSLLLHSGLRLSELCSLNRNSIKIQRLNSESGKVVGVGRVIGKGRKERDFLINLSTLKLIHTYLESRSDESTALFLSSRNRRINQRSVQHLLRAWCKRLGLPPLHPHQLRSTFATRMHKVGVPTLEISQLLGHASLDTTLFYLQPDSSRARMEFFAAHEKLAG